MSGALRGRRGVLDKGGFHNMNAKQWENELWLVSRYNFSEEVRAQMEIPEKVIFHDATLRDGEQSPGVVLLKEDKIRIAKQLDELGIQRIEAGMPAVSQMDFDAIKEISKMGRGRAG